eukprot:4310109-Alexandrium_andersonii.AAC.1
MPTRTCALRSLQRCPSRACAPSPGAASLALVLLRPAGGRCALRPSRASGLPGVKQVRAACCFYNAELDVRCAARRGDFAFTGYDADLDIAAKLMGEKFMCKIEGRLGGGPSDL